jgi:hypothetical protein
VLPWFSCRRSRKCSSVLDSGPRTIALTPVRSSLGFPLRQTCRARDLFSPGLTRSLASFLPPSNLVFGRAVPSVIVYFIYFFVSLALGHLSPRTSWLLFLLAIFVSCCLDFALSCCALSPRAAARSVFLLAFSRRPSVFCAVLGFQRLVVFSRVCVRSPAAGFDFARSALFPAPRISLLARCFWLIRFLFSCCRLWFPFWW